MNRSILTLALGGFLATPTFATAPLNQQIADFLNKYVVGNEVKTARTGQIVKDKVDTEFKASQSITNVRVDGDRGLTYTNTVAIAQTKWDLENGKRKEGDMGTNLDRVFSSECELRIPKSPTPTPFLVGYCRGVLNTAAGFPPVGMIYTVKATFDGTTLMLEQNQPNGSDCFKEKGETYACQIQDKTEYILADTARANTAEAKVLRVRFESKTYPFDFATMNRSGDPVNEVPSESNDAPKFFPAP